MDPKKNKLNIIFIGHLAIDSIIRFTEERTPSLGGSASYGSLALSCYTDQVKIGIISNIGMKNFNEELLFPFKESNIDLNGIKWFDTVNTNFILNYQNHSRTLKLKSRSPLLDFEDFPQINIYSCPDVIVLGPLCNEITIGYVKKIKKKFPKAYIGIDVQGFIRNIDSNGDISYIRNKSLIENLETIISIIGDKLILKGSEIEMKLISNKKRLFKVMKYFKRFNEGIFIMTLGESGSMIVKKGHNILNIPAFRSKSVIDETGAGDVYLSIFIYEFINSDLSWESIEKAGYFASSAASFLIEKEGTLGCESKSKVLKRIKMKNYIN